MTWRELIAELQKIPEDVLDYVACVWLPQDYVPVPDDFVEIIGFQGYDGDLPISEENLPSIEVEEG